MTLDPVRPSVYRKGRDGRSFLGLNINMLFQPVTNLNEMTLGPINLVASDLFTNTRIRWT